MTLILSNAAFAKSVTLTYEFQNQASYVSINGSSNFTTLMCDSFDNNIYKGETWTATVSPFLQGIAGSMTLLGTGLIGLAGAICRKLAKA
jgi:hypothetical protein